MSKRSVVSTLLCWLCLGLAAFAQVTITRTTCNYQDGESAMVEGRVRVGWQYELADGGRVEESPRPVQDRYQVMVVERVTGRKVYDSGMVRSSESQHISLPALSPNRHGYQWRVRIGWQSTDKRGKVARKTTEWSRWQTLRVAPADLASTARWIGAITKADAHIPDGRWSNEVFKKDTFLTRWKDVDSLSARSIIIRKEFGAKRRIADAVVHVSGLGHYELTINGRKVGDSEFAPLWSEYSRTIYYNTYDVTSLLRQGDNAIAVLLGNGFFNVQRGNRYSKLQASFGPPQLLLRLDITYDDGTTAHISSDDTWRWMESPVTFNSIFGGESYDARLEQDGCLNPGFDDSRWRSAVVVEGAGGVLRSPPATSSR